MFLPCFYGKPLITPWNFWRKQSKIQHGAYWCYILYIYVYLFMYLHGIAKYTCIGTLDLKKCGSGSSRTTGMDIKNSGCHRNSWVELFSAISTLKTSPGLEISTNTTSTCKINIQHILLLNEKMSKSLAWFVPSDEHLSISSSDLPLDPSKLPKTVPRELRPENCARRHTGPPK